MHTRGVHRSHSLYVYLDRDRKWMQFTQEVTATQPLTGGIQQSETANNVFYNEMETIYNKENNNNKK